MDRLSAFGKNGLATKRRLNSKIEKLSEKD